MSFAHTNSRFSYNIYTDESGKLHRVDGPAFETDTGEQEWFVLGWRHRDDGPAVIFPNGTAEYWFRGKYVGSHEEGKELLEQKVRRARPHRFFGKV